MRLIDADAVILSLQVIKAKNHTHLGKWENEFIDAFIAGIDEFAEKEAQPQRMKGKWDARGWNNAYWKCSNCDELTVFPFDFCPFCGSDMRGEEDG